MRLCTFLIVALSASALAATSAISSTEKAATTTTERVTKVTSTEKVAIEKVTQKKTTVDEESFKPTTQEPLELGEHLEEDTAFNTTGVISSASSSSSSTDGMKQRPQKPALGGLGNRRKNWWEGSNVCMQTNLAKASVSTSASTFVIGTGNDAIQVTRQCVHTEQTYACSIQKIENGETITETTSYECCKGFHHADNPIYARRCVRDRPTRN